MGITMLATASCNHGDGDGVNIDSGSFAGRRRIIHPIHSPKATRRIGDTAARAGGRRRSDWCRMCLASWVAGCRASFGSVGIDRSIVKTTWGQGLAE